MVIKERNLFLVSLNLEDGSVWTAAQECTGKDEAESQRVHVRLVLLGLPEGKSNLKRTG